jgi:hypothetical protein
LVKIAHHHAMGHDGPNSRLLSPSGQMIYDFHPKISAKQVMGDF